MVRVQPQYRLLRAVPFSIHGSAPARRRPARVPRQRWRRARELRRKPRAPFLHRRYSGTSDTDRRASGATHPPRAGARACPLPRVARLLRFMHWESDAQDREADEYWQSAADRHARQEGLRAAFGESAAVTLKLSRRKSSLVARLESIRVRATVRARDRAGNAATARKRFVLEAARR